MSLAPQPLTAERIERALLLLAYFIELDGDVHLQLYAKLEAELEKVRRCDDIRARARKRLDGFAHGAAAKRRLLEKGAPSRWPLRSGSGTVSSQDVQSL